MSSEVAVFFVAIREGGRLVVHVPIAGARALIGRSKSCDLVILRAQVSSKHAEVSLGPSGFQITDLQSTNGTWLNGARVQGTVDLAEADRPRIAHFSIELRREPLPDGVAFYNLLNSEVPTVDTTTTEMDFDDVIPKAASKA